MKFSERIRPSLKRRLLLMLLLPLCGVLLGGGIWGAWFVHQVVENVSDRVLSGSLQAIGETLAMQQGYLTLDLPPSALGMLENPDRDNVYYSIRYRGKLITGYSELGAPKDQDIRLEDVEFRDSTFHGVPIRVASEAKLVPQLDAPVIIQVAETVNNRTAVAKRMLFALGTGEIVLMAMIAALVLMAVDWGLKPLSLLRKEVEERNNRAEIDFAPLHLSFVPQEALPFVSAFNSLLGHVETAFETLKRFTSDASHQLRAPLTVVRTHVELLSRHSDGSAEVRDAVADMYLAVRALQHLIVQLISLAKAERPGSDDEGPATFDLIECTAATARNYAMIALEKHMDISFDATCEKLPVAGNAIFAGEMVANLLDNSIRYGAPGGHIAIRVCAEDRLLEIEDDGPGIPLKERERVFERFYRLPQDTASEGSGLGLSIVQALGRRMGASIALETPAGGQGLLAKVQFQAARGADTPSFDFAARFAPAPHELGADETV